ncbi:acyl-CoA dehydrogenase [Actinomadura craniellae]|uniref:Acyl-CoA dehydrogenase n=1 Tax=Actinomadura craniellae TaxID=2231787 RepID=A0A365HB63_9ACTN|nr:acyl-CoA dehydrogenase family protein [Actinomadura craniellae]RAY16248.1 acyl-CoA dehydrogenase [Actinomadura craniellae]
MDLTLSTDQRDLRDGLRAFLRDAWTADRLRAAADSPDLDRGAWRALADLGVFGLEVPESDGGMELGAAEAVLVFEELGRALVPGPLVATYLAAALLGRPGAATGATVVTWADRTAPVQVVEHLAAADEVIAAGEDGLWALPAGKVAGTPAGIPLDPLTPVSHVVELPAGDPVGRAAAWRDRGAVLTAALQVGVAQGALDLAVRYAGEREQFGRVIGSFQAVKHLLAESLVRVDLARAAVLTAALTLDDPAAGDLAEAVAAAKILADDAATAGGRCCVQVHGGMGFTWEVLAHLYLKRAWLLETGFGEPGVHAERLADRM